MDKFKPLIEYYRNIKNLSYDIYDIQIDFFSDKPRFD